jgi:tetratricopeptide (TPR) repeat protein
MKRDQLPMPFSKDASAFERAVRDLESCLAVTDVNSLPCTATVESNFRRVQESVEAAEQGLLPDVLAAACNAGVFFHSACLPLLTIAAGQLAERLAERLDRPNELRRALVIQAIGRVELGEYGRSTALLNVALDIAIANQSFAGQCSVWNQLGLVLHQQGQANEAVDAFEKVIELADSDATLLPYRTIALTNLG